MNYTFIYTNELDQFNIKTLTLIITDQNGNEAWRNDCNFPSNSSQDDLNNYANGIITNLQAQYAASQAVNS